MSDGPLRPSPAAKRQGNAHRQAGPTTDRNAKHARRHHPTTTLADRGSHRRQDVRRRSPRKRSALLLGAVGVVALLVVAVVVGVNSRGSSRGPDGEPDSVAPSTSVSPEPVSPARVSGVLDGVYWVGDVETGDLSQFYVGGANTAGAPDPQVVSGPGQVRSGAHAAKFTIPKGGNRAEATPQARDIGPGDDLYFGFSTMLGDGFPLDATWQVITQWKNRGIGSPPISLVVEDSSYLIDGGFGHPDGDRSYTVPIAPASTGNWVDWVFHIKFSSDPDVGYIEVWMNGGLVVPRYYPISGTLYPGANSFVKCGYYRNPDITQPGSVYFDDWRIGTSLAQ